MITILKSITIGIEFIRCLPHLIVFYFHPNKSIIQADILRWLNVMRKDYGITTGLIYLLGFHPPFRNLFYHRIGLWKSLLNIICPEVSTLVIETKVIGEGLVISHGFATAIGAESIGKNCWINQQVTIGHGKGTNPIIMDNVIIRAGAIIIGNITIGNNVVIGANTTVYKNIPDNSTVFPIHSKIMRWNDNNAFNSSKDEDFRDV
jgi:serine O-acetyltransferase